MEAAFGEVLYEATGERALYELGVEVGAMFDADRAHRERTGVEGEGGGVAASEDHRARLAGVIEDAGRVVEYARAELAVLDAEEGADGA